MLSKKLLAKSTSNSNEHFEVTEKMKSLEEEEAYKTRAGRKRHSVQLDRRISLQLMQDRRSSNASSTGDTDSLCKFVL